MVEAIDTNLVGTILYVCVGAGAFLASMRRVPKEPIAGIIVGLLWPAMLIITLSYKSFLWMLK